MYLGLQTLLRLLEPLRRILSVWLLWLVPADHMTQVVHVEFLEVAVYFGDSDPIVPQLSQQVLVIRPHIGKHEVIFEFLSGVLLSFNLL